MSHPTMAGPSAPSQLSSRPRALRDSPSRASRPPLMPTHLNTPPTSPEIGSAMAYRSFSASYGKAVQSVETVKPAAAPPAPAIQPRRLRNVKSQPLLGRANSNPTISRTAKPGKSTKTASQDKPERVIRKMSSLGLRAAALQRDSAVGLSASSSSPDLGEVGAAQQVAGKKRRRMQRRFTASAAGQTVDALACVARPRAEAGARPVQANAPPTDVFTSISGKSKSTPAEILAEGALAADQSSSEDGGAADEDEEEELAPLDPKIIFSKERFLSRHSQDFGHLYASTSAARHPAAAADKENTPVPETDVQRHDRVTEEERIKGREKRRSWMLAKAGLVEERAAIAATGTPGSAAHRRRTSLLTGSVARPLHSPDASVSGSDRRRLARQSIDLRSQPILVGGPRPLSLVASQDLKRRLSNMGVDQTPRAAAKQPQVNPSPICEEPAEIEGLGDNSPQPAADRVTRPQHARNPSSLSIPVVSRSRRVDPAASLPAPSAYVRHSDRLSTSPVPSGTSTPTRGALPPHLRNFSSSSTNSSSMSSLGAIIGGSPGASSSSCSSGGDHLGGPAELAPEAFNFRMSVIDRRSSLRYSFEESDRVTHRLSAADTAVPGLIPLGSVRTDSRQTASASARSAQLTDGSARDSVLDDKAARVKRRRARAFLVAGLKLEQGSSARLSGIDILQDDVDEQHPVHVDDTERQGRRAGLVVDEPADLALLAQLNHNATHGPDHDSALAQATQRLGITSAGDDLKAPPAGNRKRYSMLRREKLGIATQPLQEEPQTVPRSQTPLLPLYLQPSRYGSSSDRRPAESWDYRNEEGISHEAAEHDMVPPQVGSEESATPTSAASQDFPTLHRVGRLAYGQARGADQPGITISLFESDNGSERRASPYGDDRWDNASQASSSASAHGNAGHGLAPPADPSPDLSSEGSTGIWGGGMDSAELSRQLFWKQPQDDAALEEPARSSFGSIRKVQSDVGIGGTYAMHRSSAAATPTTPGFVHPDSAGASPGREQKESWSKGVRSWLTGGVKGTREGEMEKGFGDGRGGHVRKTPVQQYTTTPSTAPASQTLKEKKSWKPFSVGRGRRRGSLPEAFSMNQVASMAPSAQAAGILKNGSNDLLGKNPSRSATDPATETSVHLGSPPTIGSAGLLSPPVFPPSSFTRANATYSPMTAASFSPATPESLSTMTFPGMRVTEAPSQSSPRILSPTSDYSPHTMHDQQQPHLRWRPRVTTTGLSLLDRTRTSPILSGKRSPVSALPTLEGATAGGIQSGVGLGFNMPEQHWQRSIASCKGKGNDLDALWQTSEPEGSLHGPMPLIHVSVRPPTGYETAQAHAAEQQHGRHSPHSSLTRIASEPGSSFWKGDTLVSVNPNIRKALMVNASKATSAVGDYRVADAASDNEYGGLTLSNGRGEVLPAKLFFMLGFLLGPWIWLIGGWGLSPAGLFPSSTSGMYYSVLLPRKSSVPRHLRDPPAAISLNEADLPVDKWVKRNRWAAVASSAVFIPAMCVGFAFVGTLV